MTQKVWRQIGLTMPELNFIREFMIDNRLKNESQAVSEIINQLKRFRYIVNKLEKQAQEAETWKNRANNEQKGKIKNENELKAEPDAEKYI